MDVPVCSQTQEIIIVLQFYIREEIAQTARRAVQYSSRAVLTVLLKEIRLRFPGGGVGIDLSSRSVARQVFSALMSLTSVFGMGTGGPSSLKTPTISFSLHPEN